MKKKKIVLIQGAFEIINYGHVRAFKYSKAKGDYLIVALNSNGLIRQYKKRAAVVPWWQKKAIIASFKSVDKVVRADAFSPLKLLKKHKVDVYVISREWANTKKAEIAYMKKKGGRVCYSRRFKGVSTTVIKDKLLKEHLDGTHSKKLQRASEPESSGLTIRHNLNGPVYPVATNGHAFGVVRQRKTGGNGARLS